MAEFKISRFRYTWRDSWETGTDYIKDDVVNFGGSSWVCIRQHTAGAFASDQTFLANENDTDPSPAWTKMTDGFKWRGLYTSGLYSPGDLTLYGGNVYLCTVSNSTTPDNSTVWELYADSQGWTNDKVQEDPEDPGIYISTNGAWAPSTNYAINEIVKYGGIVYRCITSHTSANTVNGLEADQSKWAVLMNGVQFTGTWADDVRYRPNDLVKYGGSILRCVVGHLSDTAIVDANFTVEFAGFGFFNTWDTDLYYAIGDVVRYGGYSYRSKTNNQGVEPGSIEVGPANWAVLSKATRLMGDWSPLSSYKTGDLVRRGGNLYVAILDSTADGSTLDYLQADAWELVVPSDLWRNFWEEGELYSINDIITFGGSTYKCNFSHVATSQNYPGDNGSGYFYWDLILQAGENSGLQGRGDLLTYNLTRGMAGDGSTFGETNVPIGEVNQFLTVNSEDTVIYDDINQVDRVIYVNAKIGVDNETDPNAGRDPLKPFRTIRFACEYLEKEANAGYSVVDVKTGTYEEVLPIIIPARVQLFGDDKRAVNVKPKPAIAALDDDSSYTIQVLNRISGLLIPLVNYTPVTKTVGNTLDPVELYEDVYGYVSFDPQRFDSQSQEVLDYVVVGQQLKPTDSTAATNAQTLINTIVQYIQYHINNIGSDPTITGTNTRVSSVTYRNAIAVLEANKNFLAEEGAVYIANRFPTRDFDTESCKRDIRRFIEAIAYDLNYPGTYKSIMAARYYRNAVLGSEYEDMFYCRNASGIRHMTFSGLLGDLDPPNTYEVYRRPTGGAFVSLDPGWGPADDRTWIASRSPYIQDCVTFGYGTIGAKIDGSLHNGGYKSFTANDYTQIISDGIGAYVLNNGRAELVSVFTYYAQIGYFAEAGGVIRATNGNCSYGDFGALADGNDPTETPQYGKVNTRSSQATVYTAYAGEVNDEILILEFQNAGEGYTTADYTFVGSGTSASVLQEEFRDHGVYEAQRISGGLNYTLLGNNAQFGDTVSITIASNTEATEAQLLGLRVILTSGTGTGQYGYVQAYNESTKRVTVYRESDDQPGWDHVIPGRPATAVLVTSTTYRFEPRPIFDEPAFVVEETNSSASTVWTNIAYSETTKTYTALAGSVGSGTTIGIPAVTATWTVEKVARTYTVSLVNAGAGYQVGDTVTILGSVLGGVDDENDIVITVSDVSDDSTNSIVSFSYAGVGRSGVFVMTPSNGSNAAYSFDGLNWVDTSLPTAGNWKNIAAGETGFVAVRYGSSLAARSDDGISWTSTVMPASRLWNGVAYGEGIFVAVAANLNSGAISTNNGSTWTATTLPTFGDSTINEWTSIAYGNNTWVAMANSNNIAAVGTWDSENETMSWQGTIMDVIDDSSSRDWVSIAYGNGRFVILSSQGDIGYSFDGLFWYNGGTMPTQDGSTMMKWNKIAYGQGVFFAVCDTGSAVIANDATTGPTTFAATSTDGVVWTIRTLATEETWASIAFGTPDLTLGDSTVGSTSTGTWVAIAGNPAGSSIVNRIFTGARALGRVIVEGVAIKEIRIWEPGSGYLNGSPSLTIVDPNNTTNAVINNRIGNGVLAQPTWKNRGLGYKTSTTSVTILGDGKATVQPIGKFVLVDGLARLPGPGAQFRFPGNSNLYTVVKIFKEDAAADGTLSGTFQISPYLTIADNLLDDQQVEVRERYSQCRITGHDFLDVGTGNFVQTNYPELYATGQYTNAPENEILEQNGGRVFYTSSDQDGNFRTGELFAVEQATGIVTISADFFDLQGLSELRLGGVRLGGSGAVIREFSTDPLFTADSNNVVPTQKAIKAYLANKLNVGGSDLATASFIAGTVKVGPNLIRNTASLSIVFDKGVDFSGQDQVGNQVSISGFILAQDMFYKSFKDRSGR